MAIFASKSNCGFIDSSFENEMPDDAIEITREQRQYLLDGESSGKIIVWDNPPYLRDADPQAWEQVEVLRLQAYADPLTGSDRYLAEAASERIAGDEQAALAAEQKHLSRRAEIAAQYPWPEVEQ